MDKYISEWRDIGMRELEEKNMLYEIVRYYGGYLWYCQNVNENAYEAYYNHKKDMMSNIFINTANADAKKHFNKVGISGTKMRRLLMTGKGKRVISYEWISDYVKYIVTKCLVENTLRERTYSIIHNGCTYCANRTNFEEWIVLCVKRLLGFQYVLINNISQRETRKAKSAKHNIEKIEESQYMKDIIYSCKELN